MEVKREKISQDFSDVNKKGQKLLPPNTVIPVHSSSPYRFRVYLTTGGKVFLLSVSSSPMWLLFFFVLSPLRGVMTIGPCNCQPKSVWLDVMMLFDSSTATTDNGLQTMLAYALTSFNFVNVENASCTDQFHTRVGIIVYARSTRLLYPLGSLNKDQLENITSLPFIDQNETNIEGAMRLAVTEFNGTAHRKNVRRVIFLLATAYNPLANDSPKQYADSFIENNGIIVVYNNIQANGIPNPYVEELASPGYFFTNLNDPCSIYAKKALCDANCFCIPKMKSYRNDINTSVPLDGCYHEVTTQSNWLFAQRTCALSKNGILSIDYSFDKSNFLLSLLSPGKNFWNGLRWNSTIGNYTWSDGSPFTGDYQPFLSSRVDGMDCVFVDISTSNLGWRYSDCRVGMDYICEEKACDSINYCTAILQT